MNLIHRLRRPLRESVVLRSTLIVLGFSALVGLVVGLVAVVLMGRHEAGREQLRLQALLASVDGTARAAVFVGDAELARQVVAGMLANPAVQRVRIITFGPSQRARSVLAEDARRPSRGVGGAPLRHPLYSPFQETVAMGEIELEPNRAHIATEVFSLSRLIAVALGLQAAAIAAVVARVVFNTITRPVTQIAAALHGVGAQTGQRLACPRGNRDNEIGRLVRDTNGMIARLEAATEQERELRRAREHSEARLRLIFENAESGLFALDRDGRLLSWNPALARLLALPPLDDDRSPPRLAELLPEHQALIEALVARCLAHHHGAEQDMLLPSQRWLHLQLYPVEGGLLQGLASDITERKRAERAAETLARQDPLTGLRNRLGMEERLGELLTDYRQDARARFAVMLIDLDWFKQVNDQYGHEAGDETLREVARRLLAAVRRSDVVCRLGGDEFVVLLPGIDESGVAVQIAAKIVASLSEPIVLGAQIQARIGASLGLALAGPEDQDAGAVLRRADEAMYAAKQGGRAGYRLST